MSWPLLSYKRTAKAWRRSWQDYCLLIFLAITSLPTK